MLLIIYHHGFYEVWTKDGRGEVIARECFLSRATAFCGTRRYRIAA